MHVKIASPEVADSTYIAGSTVASLQPPPSSFGVPLAKKNRTHLQFCFYKTHSRNHIWQLLANTLSVFITRLLVGSISVVPNVNLVELKKTVRVRAWKTELICAWSKKNISKTDRHEWGGVFVFLIRPILAVLLCICLFYC